MLAVEAKGFPSLPVRLTLRALATVVLCPLARWGAGGLIPAGTLPDRFMTIG